MAPTPDQVYGDSEWLRAQPGFANKFSQLLMNYGIVPDAATLSKYGLSDLFDPSQAQGAASNPYSLAAQLKNTLSGSLTSNATSANSHGALFSGAFQNMQDQAGRDYTKNYSQAGSQELSDLLGIQGDREGVYNSVFGRLLGTPATPDVSAPGPGGGPAAAPAPLPIGQPTGVGTGTPTPQYPYQRRGPEAGSAPKKPKPVNYSGRAL